MWTIAVFVFQSKGVRLVVVAIGPDAEKAKYQTVLYEIGGKNVFFVRDYSELDKMISNITNIICRKLILYITLPCLALLFFALFCFAFFPFPSLLQTCLFIPCFAISCLTPPCPALPCFALPFLAFRNHGFVLLFST